MQTRRDLAASPRWCSGYRCGLWSKWPGFKASQWCFSILYYTLKLDLRCSLCNFTERGNLGKSRMASPTWVTTHPCNHAFTVVFTRRRSNFSLARSRSLDVALRDIQKPAARKTSQIFDHSKCKTAGRLNFRKVQVVPCECRIKGTLGK